MPEADTENPFTDDETPETGLVGQVRASFSVLALAVLLLTASSSGVLGGLVAMGVGGEPLDRPTGFSFDTDKNESVTGLVIRHAGGEVTHPDRVFVVDDEGNRVSWATLQTDTGVARYSGVESELGCLQQGDTVRIVFEGRTISGTISAHQVTAPITSESVDACTERASQYSE